MEDLPDGVHRVPCLGHNIEIEGGLQAAIMRPRHHCRNQIRSQILMCQSEMNDRAYQGRWARGGMGNLPEVWALGGREEKDESLLKARILGRIRLHDVPMRVPSRDRARIRGQGD